MAGHTAQPARLVHPCDHLLGVSPMAQRLRRQTTSAGMAVAFLSGLGSQGLLSVDRANSADSTGLLIFNLILAVAFAGLALSPWYDWWRSGQSERPPPPKVWPFSDARCRTKPPLTGPLEVLVEHHRLAGVHRTTAW
jgi:hypothetical protein